MNRLTISLLISLAASGIAIAGPQQDLCRLSPFEPVLASPVGWHETGLDIDGSFLAAQVVELNRESVQVRRRGAPSWEAPDVIPSPDPFNVGFGHVVELEEEFFGVELMVASLGGQHPAGNGVIYRYFRQPGGWVPLPEFRTTDPMAQIFGTNFVRGSNLTAVQSQNHLFATTEARVHLFEIGAISWGETATILHPDPLADSSRFGSAMATDDGLLVISSQEAPRGRVWVWQHASGGQLALLQELIPTSPSSASFGADVAIFDGHIAVSDPGVESVPGQASRGAVTIFDRNNPTGSFNETARFVPSNPQATEFGRSIDLDDNRLAVSFTAPSSIPGDFRTRDGVAVIDGIAGGPLLLRQFVGDVGDALTAVGRIVELGEGEVVTSSTYLPVGPSFRIEPALRRFAVEDPTVQACPGIANSTGSEGALDVVGCATVGELRLRASRLPSSVFGLPVVGTLDAMLPVGGGFLCIGDPIRGAIVQANAAGVADMTFTPSALGFMGGSTVLAQFWHRDSFVVSTLTEAIRVELAP